MKTPSSRFLILVAGACLFLSIPTASMAENSFTLSNKLFKMEHGLYGTCQSVKVTCWSNDGNGFRKTLPRPLIWSSPQSLTLAGSCDSLDVTVTCHYFKSTRASGIGHMAWVDESKTQTCPGGSHGAEIGTTEVRSGSSVYDTLKITCQ